MEFKITPILLIVMAIIEVVHCQRRYQCNNDARWPEFTHINNGTYTCLRCPKNCETCLPETTDPMYPCRKCFEGHGFEPSPTARQMLENSTRISSNFPRPPSNNNSSGDKQQHNETSAEFDDPFTWFVGGLCEDCLTIGKYPMFANTRLRLTPASQFTPYEGRLEVYYSGKWWAVCDDLWNMRNTHIACWELGLGLGVSFYYEYYQMPPSVPLDPIPIAFDNVECKPDETSLFRCKRSEFLKHNCDISETLGIKCSGPKHNSICVSDCPIGQWLDPAPTGRVCKPCSENCLQCQSDPTVCIACEENMYLATNKSCVWKCSLRFYGDTSERMCKLCDPHCVTCADGLRNDICLSCPFDKVLYEHKCMDVCPENSYWIQLATAYCLSHCPEGYFVTDSTCEKCSSKCKTCVGEPTNCTLCGNNQVLTPPGINNQLLGTCHDKCDRGYFPDPDNICKVCKQSSCGDCYLGGDYCKECRNNFKLQFHICVTRCDKGLFNYSGICTEYCPPGYFGDHKSGSCMPCISPCKQCINGDTCTECFSGRHLDQGGCVESCRDGHVAISMDRDSNTRLVGSNSDLEGFVQVWRNNSWAYLCVDAMSIEYGQLICESLALGGVLQIRHYVRKEQVSSYILYDDSCFTSPSNYKKCLYNTMHLTCTKQVPFLRCQGPNVAEFTDKCVQLNNVSCAISHPCSNETICQDISNNGTSYCESCPKGYVGDGYTCEKTDLSSDKIRILFPPTDVQLLNWPEGLDLQLPCVVNQPDLVRLSWYKDGLQLYTDKDKRLESSGTLTLFQPVGRPDSGLYVCMVLLHGKVVASRTYNVTVQERIVITNPPRNFLGSGVVSLTCVYKGYPPAVVIWSKDQQPVTVGSEYMIAHNGTLIISAARPHHTGVYRCVARNDFTQDSAQATVTISGMPVIMNKAGLTGAALGKELRVVCEASGGPAPNIYWKKNGKDIEWNDRVKVIYGNTLLIVKVEPKDAGLYKCIARNVLGEDVWITNVTVMDFPSGEISEMYEEASIGMLVSFICAASPSWPPPQRKWSLPGRGHFIESNRTAGVQVIDDKILIGSVLEKDSGNITCTISNPAGSIALVARLVIRVPPRFINAPMNTTLVDSWRSHLPWTVYAIPTADTKWEHPPGTRLNGRNGYNINESGLYFTPSWPESVGLYGILAINDEGPPLQGGAYVHVIKTFSAIPTASIIISGGTITIPIETMANGVTFDMADILLAYVGNGTQHVLLETSPYNVGFVNCNNESACSEVSYNMTSSMFKVGVIEVSSQKEMPSHFTIGDDKYYSSDNMQVFNPQLMINAWYAVSVRYFKREDNEIIDENGIMQTSYKMLAAVNYTYVFMEQSDPPSSKWKIIVPVVLLLLIIMAIAVTLLILHKRGFPILDKIRNLTQWSCICQKDEGFNLDDNVIDIQSYLPQFSPNPSPTHIKKSKQPEVQVSAVYIPTEDEIEHMMAIGINYYDDDNWLTQVPEGVLELSVDNLNRLKESKSNDIVSNDMKGSIWRKLPVVPKEILRKYKEDTNDSNFRPVNSIPSTSGVNKKQTLTVNTDSSPGSASISTHPAVIHSPSSGSDSATDSGFNEVLPRTISLSTRTGQTLAREVVNIMKMRKSRGNRENASETRKNMTAVNSGSRQSYLRSGLINIKDKLVSAAGVVGNQFVKVQQSLSKSKRTITLESIVSLEERRESNYKLKPVSNTDTKKQENELYYITKEQNEFTKISKPPAVARRNFVNDSSESESEEYIDPTSIVSVPKITARMKELQHHNQLKKSQSPTLKKLLPATQAIVTKSRQQALHEGHQDNISTEDNNLATTHDEEYSKTKNKLKKARQENEDSSELKIKVNQNTKLITTNGTLIQAKNVFNLQTESKLKDLDVTEHPQHFEKLKVSSLIDAYVSESQHETQGYEVPVRSGSVSYNQSTSLEHNGHRSGSGTNNQSTPLEHNVHVKDQIDKINNIEANNVLELPKDIKVIDSDNENITETKHAIQDSKTLKNYDAYPSHQPNNASDNHNKSLTVNTPSTGSNSLLNTNSLKLPSSDSVSKTNSLKLPSSPSKTQQGNDAGNEKETLKGDKNVYHTPVIDEKTNYIHKSNDHDNKIKHGGDKNTSGTNTEIEGSVGKNGIKGEMNEDCKEKLKGHKVEVLKDNSMVHFYQVLSPENDFPIIRYPEEDDKPAPNTNTQDTNPNNMDKEEEIIPETTETIRQASDISSTHSRSSSSTSNVYAELLPGETIGTKGTNIHDRPHENTGPENSIITKGTNIHDHQNENTSAVNTFLTKGSNINHHQNENHNPIHTIVTKELNNSDHKNENLNLGKNFYNYSSNSSDDKDTKGREGLQVEENPGTENNVTNNSENKLYTGNNAEQGNVNENDKPAINDGSSYTDFLLAIVNEPLSSTDCLIPDSFEENKDNYKNSDSQINAPNSKNNKIHEADNVKSETETETSWDSEVSGKMHNSKKRFTMSDTYKSKPPKRLKIPDVFKN